MESSLYRKLIATILITAAAGTAAIVYLAGRYVEQQQVAAARDRLVSIARLLSDSVSREVPGATASNPLSQYCRTVDADVELVDSKGMIVADCSGTLAPAHGNTISDPEVQEALRSKISTVVRRTGGRERVYTAITASDGSGRVLRLSANVGSAPGSSVLQWQIIFIGLAVALVWVIAARTGSRSLMERAGQLNVRAGQLLDAHELKPVTVIEDEFGALERTLERTAGQLHELFEQWLLESTRSEAILSSMAEGVLAVDRDLRVVFSNQAVIRAMGVQAPVKDRTPILELVRHSELVNMLKQVVHSGESVKLTINIPISSGRAFEVQAAPFATSGGQGALAIFYDMTDLERLEQVRKDFVANVSHEMRTPLAAIVGYADTLLDGGIEDEHNNRRFVEIIRTNAIRLNSIASDLLVLSELESGHNPGEPESVSVRDVLESAISSIESEARSRRVNVFRGDLPDAKVRGYRFRLEQAMLNLLVNAVKFNREGGAVRVEACHKAKGQVTIAVCDTGMGIPSHDLPRIFERFYRVDKARSRQVGGTGLGLSIVRHVVERMDGKIEVESQVGKGSTFTIILPTC